MKNNDLRFIIAQLHAGETFTRIDEWLPIDAKERSITNKMYSLGWLLEDQLKKAAPA